MASSVTSENQFNGVVMECPDRLGCCVFDPLLDQGRQYGYSLAPHFAKLDLRGLDHLKIPRRRTAHCSIREWMADKFQIPQKGGSQNFKFQPRQPGLALRKLIGQCSAKLKPIWIGTFSSGSIRL